MYHHLHHLPRCCSLSSCSRQAAPQTDAASIPPSPVAASGCAAARWKPLRIERLSGPRCWSPQPDGSAGRRAERREPAGLAEQTLCASGKAEGKISRGSERFKQPNPDCITFKDEENRTAPSPQTFGSLRITERTRWSAQAQQQVVQVDHRVSARRRQRSLVLTVRLCPLTRQGTIVVDGVMASCYAAVDGHRLAHRAFALHRWTGSAGRLGNGLDWYSQITLWLGQAVLVPAANRKYY
ncbi:sonic hedgehog protein-like [Poeciliopsis prolifica]|uniref:sonic hedgehog protein-like n=1 Tax=Poeciliopsis prolifica TaxID=188132 RepID=UPI002413D538|nr:sonic hedgehog protein-like [Poeciliopsis prolifica]